MTQLSADEMMTSSLFIYTRKTVSTQRLLLIHLNYKRGTLSTLSLKIKTNIKNNNKITIKS